MKYFAVLVLVFSLFASAGDIKFLKIGETVPAFSLKNYDGKEFSLDKVRKENKFTVIMFIATQCPVSNAYNERMVKLNDLYAKKGVVFIGINSNKRESELEIAQHAKDNGFKFPVLKDKENKVADSCGAQVTPEIFILNTDGKLLYHGRIDDNRNTEKVKVNDLAVALDALLAGKEPPKAETKAFGCSIKRISAE